MPSFKDSQSLTSGFKEHVPSNVTASSLIQPCNIFLRFLALLQLQSTNWSSLESGNMRTEQWLWPIVPLQTWLGKQLWFSLIPAPEQL